MKLRTALLILSGLCAGTAQAELRILHQERSMYRNILITEDGERRCMRFTFRDQATHNQSCYYLADKQKLAFEYTRMALTAVLAHPAPKRILVLGLGGGTLPTTFTKLWPDVVVDSVEIDPSVVKAATQWFDYKESDRLRTVIMDARVYMKRAIKKQQQWDVILLDAFNGDYIPEHLMTKEFLEEVRSGLAPNGFVVANTFATSKLYHHESTTYEAVYPHLKMLRAAGGNRVLIASPTPVSFPLSADAQTQWQAKLGVLGVDLKATQSLLKDADWDKSARIMTDQFAPANLLKH